MSKRKIAVPPDFAAAAWRSNADLASIYAVSEAVVCRWRRETGLRRKDYPRAKGQRGEGKGGLRMTMERRDELAHICAELTDNLPLKFERVGAALMKDMKRANRPSCEMDCSIAVGLISGALDALSIMGVPYKVLRKGEYGDYAAVELAGETFYVSEEGGAEEGKEESG